MLRLGNALLEGSVRFEAGGLNRLQDASGKATSPYGLWTSVSWMPPIALGRMLHNVWPQSNPDLWTEFLVSFVNSCVVWMLLAALGIAWRERGVDEEQICQGLWIFASGTLLWPYSKWPYSDTWMAFWIFVAWWLPTRPNAGWKAVYFAGLAAGMAMLTRRQADAVLPFLLLATVWNLRGCPKSHAVAESSQASISPFDSIGRLRSAHVVVGIWIIGLLPSLGVRAWYNWARFDSIWLERHHAISRVPRLFQERVFDRAFDVGFGMNEGWLVYMAVPLMIALLASSAWRRQNPAEWRGILLLVAAGFALLAWLPFGPSVCFGSRYAIYLIPLLGIGWAYLPNPLPTLPRAILQTVWIPSIALMAAGTVVDSVAATNRAQSIGHGGTAILQGYAGEVRRQFRIGLGATTMPQGMPDPDAWSHPPFQRPDLWWIHIARMFLNSQKAESIPPPSVDTTPEISPLPLKGTAL